MLALFASVPLGLLALELIFRSLEPALPTHRLWHDSLPAVRVRQMLDVRRRVKHVDFVVCGSSVIHSGIDPAVVADRLGRETIGYNAALHRGFIDMVVPWVVTTVLPILRPRTVVLLADVFEVNDRGAALWDDTAKYRASLLGGDGVVAAIGRRLERISALFRHHRLLVRPRTLLAAVAHRRAGTTVPDDDVRGSRVSVGPNGEWTGFHGRRYLTTDAMRRHVTEGVLGDFVVGPRRLEIYERELQALQRVVPSIVLTTVPLSDDLLDALPRGEADATEARAALRAIADRLGIPMVEPRVTLTMDEHFADIAHLNERGMAAFSAALGDELAAVLSAASMLSPRAR